jgi:hypothetical protein
MCTRDRAEFLQHTLGPSEPEVGGPAPQHLQGSAPCRAHREKMAESAGTPPTRQLARYGGLRTHELKNGGVRKDPAIPARARLPTDQGRPHGNCIGASIRWTGRARGHEPVRIPQWHPGQYQALTKNKPRHQPSRPETRPNQRLHMPLGSPPLVAVGSSSARATHRSRAPHTLSAENGLDCGASKGFKVPRLMR